MEEEKSPIILKIDTIPPPVQEVGMPIEAYANILQDYISHQEKELSLKKAALVNILNSNSQLLVHERLPDGYSAIELSNYRKLVVELAKVENLPNSPSVRW